jgi:hypothetical protein
VEELYCSLEYSRQEELLVLRNAEIAEVQRETREIGKKIKDHLQIITKGREMIARKDVCCCYFCLSFFVIYNI